MPNRRNEYRKSEYVVEGSTAKLAYLDNERKNSMNRYSYRNSRGEVVTVERQRQARRRVANDDYYEYVTVPEYEEEIKKQAEEKKRSKALEMLSVDFKSLLVLAIALVMVGYVCMSYLSVQAEIKALKDEIAAVEQQIESLKSANTSQMLQIEDSVDLDKVYRVATKELGMVHPKEEQVLTYHSQKGNTVRQYSDIPEVQQDVVSRILGGN